MDDVDRRLSAMLPLPLAVAWRGIYTEEPEVAYTQLLALAENLTTYLALIGIAASRSNGITAFVAVRNFVNAPRRAIVLDSATGPW